MLDQPVELFLFDHQRRRQSNHLLVGVFRQDAKLEQPNGVVSRRTSFRFEIDSYEQPAASDFPDSVRA